MPQISTDRIQNEAINIVRIERQTWEDATAFISDRVAFQMRNLIRQLRKNFWGVFDRPDEPTTGRKKIWIPLTETLVDSVLKNIDLDTKDITFRAKKEESMGLAAIVRAVVKHELEEISFGEYLDEFEKKLAVDGTAVWKTIKYKDADGKYCLKIVPVDLLNIYIDPTAHSIAEAYRFTERGLLTEQDVRSMADAGWINTEKVEGTLGLSPIDPQYKFSTSSNGTKMVDVWETWGKVPRYLITGNSEDKEEIEGHIIISGLDSSKPKLHLLEANTDGKRSYEEAWYSRVPGRWYGRGVAEKVMWLQLWLNTVVNARITRSTIAQLGLFKIRKGSGITPQMISRLPVNGALVMNSLEDMEQMPIADVPQSAYTDENVVWNWGQRQTSAFDAITGESLPASTPATNAALSAQGARNMFTLVKQQIGMFLQRWVKHQAMPVIFKNISREDIIQMVGDSDEINELDKRIIHAEIFDQVNKIHKDGLFIDPVQIENEIQRGLDKLSSVGRERYVKLLHDLDPTEYDVEVDITNESFDKSALAANLLQMLQVIPALPELAGYAPQIVQEIMDISGLDAWQFKPNKATQPIPGGQQQMMNQNNLQQQQNPTTRPGGNPPAPVMPQTPGQALAPNLTKEPR